MKNYKPHIRDFGYPLCATEEIREALISLGFHFPNPSINRGCHWGEVYFHDEDLKLAKFMIDEKDRHFRIETETRFFYVSPYDLEIGPHWQFSVTSNKPRVYKPRVRRKRGPYHN